MFTMKCMQEENSLLINNIFKMNKNQNLYSATAAILVVTFIIIFSACSKDEEPQAEIDDKVILQYLSDNNIDAVKHESGLYYDITKEGSGSHPDINSNVTVSYKGYLISGNVFDQTPAGSTTSFPLTAVIKGWQIGVPLLKQGGEGLFFIPSELGYGSSGTTDIPANSVLIFEIGLADIN